MPLFIGYLLCGGSQCCIYDEKIQPNVSHVINSIIKVLLVSPLSMSFIVAVILYSSYFIIATGLFLSNFTLFFHQPYRLFEEPVIGFPWSNNVSQKPHTKLV